MVTVDAGARPRSQVDRGLALILVGEIDRRVLPALLLAARLPELEPRALHIAVDPEESRRLADLWMELDLSWVPLDIVELGDEPFLDCIQRIVAAEAAERSRVLVVVPEVDLDRWWQTLLHRGNGRRIARRLLGHSRVSTIVLPFPR